MNPQIHWPDETLPVEICCAPGVLTNLEIIATDGLLAMPRTGLGVGGLLLGKRAPGRLEILKTAEIACSHALGPAFLLTHEEIAACAELSLAGHELVGWYCSKPAVSNPNSPLTLIDRDGLLFDALCPEQSQVALLIRPRLGKTTTAAFALRAPNDSGNGFFVGAPKELAWQELSAFQEPAPVSARQAGKLPEGIPEPEPDLLDVPIAMPQAGTLFGTSAAEAGVPNAGRWPLRLLIAVILLMLSAAAFFTRGYWMPRRTVALIAWPDSTGRVSYLWNSEALREQDRATLVIDDGGGPLHTIRLDETELRSGYYQYICRPGTVDATLLAGDLSDAVTVTVKPRRLPESYLPESGISK